MKWFAIVIVCIALISTYQWRSSSSSIDVTLPTTAQLNQMVGREGAPRIPLTLTEAGN